MWISGKKYLLTPDKLSYIIAMLVSLKGKLCPKQQPYPYRRLRGSFWKVPEQPSQIFRIQKGYATIRSFPAAAARGSDGSQAGDFHSGSRTGLQDLLLTWSSQVPGQLNILRIRRKYKWQRWHSSPRKDSALKCTVSCPEWAPRAAERSFLHAGAKAENRSRSDPVYPFPGR